MRSLERNMPSGRRGQIKHVYVRRRASTDVDARRATDVDGRRRARCEWAFILRVLVSSRSPGGADVNILPIEFFIVAFSFALFHTFIIVT